MTEVSITMTTEANAIGVFLHYPDNREPLPLPEVAAGWTGPLDAGVHAIAASGTANTPGTEVKFTIETAVNSLSRKRTVRGDGTLRGWITFELDAQGKVS